MEKFNYHNKELLLSLKPKYHIYIYLILIVFLAISILLFCLKTYDVYNIKGVIDCNEKCNIRIIVDINNTNKLSNINFIKINNKNIYPDNILISEIQIDEINNINYQEVNYQVDQLEYGIDKTIQDIKVYSNYDLIIRKLIKFIL